MLRAAWSLSIAIWAGTIECCFAGRNRGWLKICGTGPACLHIHFEKGPDQSACVRVYQKSGTLSSGNYACTYLCCCLQNIVAISMSSPQMLIYMTVPDARVHASLCNDAQTIHLIMLICAMTVQARRLQAGRRASYLPQCAAR